MKRHADTARIQTILREIGLHDVESRIYLALLSCGGGTVADIARNAQLKRPTIYEHIDDLAARGIIRKTVKGKRVVYLPADPKKLVQIVSDLQKKVASVFPFLQSMFLSVSKRPVVRFYEGKQAIREVYRETTKTSHTIWNVFSAERYFALFTEKDGEEFFRNLRERGGSLRDLVLNTPRGVEYVKADWGRETVKSKLLPREFNFTVDLLVAGDVLVLISLEHLVAVVIENAEIADLERQLMKFIWKQLR